MEEVLSMAVDNGHARSEHPRQGSTLASHVWTRQLNSQANRTEICRRKRDGEAFWPCDMVVLLLPTPGLSMEDLEIAGIVLPTPAHLVHVGI